MADILLELLGLILEPLLDALFQYVIATLVDVLLRSLGEAFQGAEIRNPALASAGFVFSGLVLGGASLLLFPHRLVHPSRFHGISLLVSPVITGLLMWATGAALRQREKKVTRLESFGYGFVFAFGIAFIRFLFAK